MGLVNGTVIAALGINALITTLATMQIVRGCSFIVSDGKAVGVGVSAFFSLGIANVLGVPMPVWIMAVCFLTYGVLLNRTVFGRNTLAIGGNMEAARLAGINVDGVTIATYGLGGLFAGIAGIVLLGETNIGQPASATDWPLTAIAAVVVGGVPLSGGVGKVGGAVLGTLLLGIIANALNLLGISPFWQPAVTGAVILVAVGLDAYQRRRGERR